MPSGHDALKLAPDVLGYLNFSSGAPDPRFLGNLNTLFGLVAGETAGGKPAWQALAERLRQSLRDLRGRSDAFRQTDQAEAVLALVFDHLLGAYRQFHRDLLVPPDRRGPLSALLPRPGAARRSCSKAARGTRPIGSCRDAISQLNDYLGHRPVAVLRTQQKIQPYAHEWVRPIPLWIRGAGVAEGPYHDLVQRALAILEATDPMLLLEAMFDPALLGRIGGRSPRLRLRPPGQQAAQLPLRAVGPGQAGQLGPLPPLHRAADLAGRHARAPGRPRRAALRGGALRGGRGAGGHDVDGLGDQRQPAGRPRFERHPGRPGAADRRLPRRLLRAAAGGAERPARRAVAGGSGGVAAAAGRGAAALQPAPGPPPRRTVAARATWRSSLRGWAIRRRRPGRSASCRSPRRG